MGNRKKRIQTRLLNLLMPFFLFFFACYTIYQLLNGERGLFTWINLRQQIHVMETQNQVLKDRKQLLEAQAYRLHPDSLDEDYVDELIRRKLPYLKPEDMVMYVKESASPTILVKEE